MCKATPHPRRPRPLIVIAGANSPRSVTTTLHNLPFRAWERSIEDSVVPASVIEDYVAASPAIEDYVSSSVM